MNKKLLEYLLDFMTEKYWDDDKIPEQVRAIFTTLCFIGNIDVDTYECDCILSELYHNTSIKDKIEYNEFDSFMCELIV